MESTPGMATVPRYLLPGVTIIQPPHLEGDPALATEILPGPPFLFSTQQSGPKHDPRKPATLFSYLPATDPGSTYSMHITGALGSPEASGPRRKRARVERGRVTGRAQRASARNMNGSTVAPDMTGFNDAEQVSSFQVDSDPLIITLDSDDLPISRANSMPNSNEGTFVKPNGYAQDGRKDKGKARETDSALVCVKEEPKMISLHSPDPPLSLSSHHPHASGNRILTSLAGQLNEDHCSACHSQGALVYCDGCPRAFHFWCLDPPMELTDLPEGDSRWFCPGCTIRKNPPPRPPPSFLSPLIHHVHTSLPAEYQLPEDIRTFFKDVVTGPRGTYVDGAAIKQPRLNRHGQLEDRDPHRLRDRNGAPVLCFRCGTSALPGGLTASKQSPARPSKFLQSSAETGVWKSIVSCDHCPLHWHLDCLDPPLPNMPPFGKKWMCPNHADQLLRPKRRIPKHNAPPIVITKQNQFNNGNIEVTRTQTAFMHQNNVAVDEIWINGRRYRVPERAIVLDFWNKVGKAQNASPSTRDADILSDMSSPLTSLSSLEDQEETTPGYSGPPHDLEAVKAAEILCGLRNLIRTSSPATGSHREMVDRSVQTEAEPPHQEQKANKRRGGPRKVPESNIEGSGSSLAPRVSLHTSRSRRSAGATQTEATRDLRSRSKNRSIPELAKPPEGQIAESSKAKGSTPQTRQLPSSASKLKTSPTNSKLETREIRCIALNGLDTSETAPSLSPPPVKPTSSPRKRNGRPSKLSEEIGKEDTELRGRGKKRKERDEGGVADKEGREDVSATDKERREKKLICLPNRQQPATPSSTPAPLLPTSSPAHVAPQPPSSTTPSLKIRLPRLSSVNLISNFGAVRPSSNLTTSKRP